MSDCVGHEPCPECRKRGNDRAGDNLAVYPDHKYCFSCGHWEGEKHEFHTVEKTEDTRGNSGNNLPLDFSHNLRRDALAWIKQYGITNEELERSNVGWSDSKELLIFPVFDPDGKMVMWQGRYFGTNKTYPKYDTKGFKEEVYHVLGVGQPLVIVEDFVSCLKLSRQTSSLPLWGSSVSIKRARLLSRKFDRVAIWLDPDKKAQSILYSNRCELFFKQTRIIYSDKDPKFYSDGEITNYLRS